MKHFVLLSSVCIVLAGCGGSSSITTSSAQVRVIDVLHSTGNVGLDVTGGINAFANNIFYGTVQSYAPASTTPQVVTVYAHGTATQVVAGTSLTFAANAKTTLLLTGTQGSSAAMVQVPDNTAPPTVGDFKIRLIHGAQLAGGDVDLYLLPPAGNINTASPFVSNLTYGDVSIFVEFTAGTAQNLKVVPAGQKAPILASLSLTPVSGDIDTVLMQDSGASITTSIVPN